MNIEMICAICRKPLTWADQGWAHQDGRKFVVDETKDGRTTGAHWAQPAMPDQADKR